MKFSFRFKRKSTPDIFNDGAVARRSRRGGGGVAMRIGTGTSMARVFIVCIAAVLTAQALPLNSTTHLVFAVNSGRSGRCPGGGTSTLMHVRKIISAHRIRTPHVHPSPAHLPAERITLPLSNLLTSSSIHPTTGHPTHLKYKNLRTFHSPTHLFT